MLRTNTNRPVARTALVSVGLLVVAGTAGGIALAEPPNAGFIPDPPMAKVDLQKLVHLNRDGVKFQTRGPTDVTVQKITFAPGGNSGWHHHPGMVLVAVQSGAVTVTDAKCRKTVYGPGQTAGSAFVESGSAPARVTSAGGAVVYATFVTPDGKPLRVDDAALNCPL